MIRSERVAQIFPLSANPRDLCLAVIAFRSNTASIENSHSRHNSRGIELMAIGLYPKFGVIAGVLAIMGGGAGFVNVQFSTWLQLRVDRAILGRVMSVMMFSAVGLIPVSYAISGVLAQRSIQTLYVAAGAILVVTSAAALTAPAARQLD